MQDILNKDTNIHFTEEHINNKKLVVQMLKYEDSIILGDEGKSIYQDETYDHFTTLEAKDTFNRIALNHFNFKTTDDDVINYRKIFLNYYRSPFDYDADVINSVAYMRENRCVFYKGRDYNINDTFEDVSILTTSKTSVNLLDKINKEDNFTFIGSFSTS